MPIRVLIADDHAVVRQALSIMLQQAPDLEIVGEAKDGQDAVERVQSLGPDVVLMDISMPRMNGIEATRMIAKLRPDVRVVGLSMHNDREMIDRMLQAGAVQFVTKSAASEELLAAIQSAGRQPSDFGDTRD